MPYTRTPVGLHHSGRTVQRSYTSNVGRPGANAMVTRSRLVPALRGRPGAIAQADSHTAPSLLVMAAMLAVLFTVFVAIVLPTSAFAVPSTSTTLVLRGEVKQRVDGLQNQAAAVQTEIDTLDTNLEHLTEAYNQLNVDLDTINQDLTGLRRRLQQTEDLHQTRQSRLDKRLADAYKSGSSGASNVIAMLLTTEDFSDFLERLFLITKVTVQDQMLVEHVRDSADVMDEVAVQIEAKKAEALAVRRELDQKQMEIEGLLSERRSVLAGLDSQIAALIEQERARQEAERLRLEAEFRSRLTGWERYDGPLPQIDDVVLKQVVETAAAYLGVPYVWGGEKPKTGLDCSGLAAVHLPPARRGPAPLFGLSGPDGNPGARFPDRARRPHSLRVPRASRGHVYR